MRALFSRGVSLGGTLLAVAVLSLLAFTLSSLCVTHLRLTNMQDRGVLASNAARSAVSAAISKILEQHDFGKDRRADHEIRIQTDDAEAVLTFNEEVAQNNGIPHSTNNLEGSGDVPGAGGVLVPSATVYLSAVGTSGTAKRRIEAVLRVPPFPWAIASGGRIETKNGVVVAALPEGVWPPPTDIEELLPADLVANGTDSQAIFLGSDSTVLGDIETPGQVVLGPDRVEVRGEVRSGAAAVELPTLRPTDHDPQTTGAAHFTLSEGNVEEIVGSARASANLTFDEPLKLVNGQLYVDGDLTLREGIQGTGILVATGDITIDGAAQLDGATELAVISGGRVSLSGAGANRATIRGLFYAEQGLDAAELTLVGSLLTGQASTGVELDRVSVFYEAPKPITMTTPDMVDSRYPGGMLISRQGRQRLMPPVPGLPGQDAFFFEIRSTNGAYPLTITVVAGRLPLSIPPQSLASGDELIEFRQSLVAAIRPLVSAGNPGDFECENIPAFADQVCQTIASDFSDSEPGIAPPSVALFGDISRFLPIEDRIRIISWVEK